MIICLNLIFDIQKNTEFSGHHGAIYSLVRQPETPFIYSAGGDGWIVRWDISDPESPGQVIADAQTKIFSTAFSSDGNLLMAGDINGLMYWIDITKREILSKTALHKGSIFDICILGAQTAVSISGDGYFCVWNLEKRLPVLSTKLSNQGLRCAAFDQVRNELYIGASDNCLYVIDCSDWEVKYKIANAHSNSIFSIELMRNAYFLSGGRDAQLNVRDINTSELKHNINAHWYTLNKIKYLAEFKLIVTASRDKSIRIWDADTFELLKTLDKKNGGHINSVNTILWIPEYNQIVSAGDDRIISVWQIIH
jgi:WD40 repeat protein